VLNYPSAARKIAPPKPDGEVYVDGGVEFTD
jgi:hypothetical protein